jgi:hypothetical protein
MLEKRGGTRPDSKPLGPAGVGGVVSARRFLPVLALAALLFAGCSGPQAAPETSAGQSQSASPAGAAAGGAAIANATALPPPADLAFTGCLQLHTFFPFPTAVLAQIGFEMPDGFSFASEDGATVKVFLAWWACPEGHLTDGINAPFAPVGSMFASLPVLPPADLAARDPNATAPQLDLFPLVWIVSNQVAANHLAGIAGLDDGYVETGDVLRTTDLQGPTQVEGMQAHASFGTFDADAAFQPAPGDNPAGRYRMWLVPGDGAITQYVDIANGAGRTLGSGYADLRFQGDPGAGAPPATGGLSHVADGTDVLVRVVDLSKP